MLTPDYKTKAIKQEYKALKTFHAFGRWINRGEVFTMPDCSNCVKALLKTGKVEKV